MRKSIVSRLSIQIHIDISFFNNFIFLISGVVQNTNDSESFMVTTLIKIRTYLCLKSEKNKRVKWKRLKSIIFTYFSWIVSIFGRSSVWTNDFRKCLFDNKISKLSIAVLIPSFLSPDILNNKKPIFNICMCAKFTSRNLSIRAIFHTDLRNLYICFEYSIQN